jgi:hypothetical protein
MSRKAASHSPRFGARIAAQIVVAAAAAVVLAVAIWASIPRNLDLPWTSIRLAPSFALAKGLPLYSTPQQPPWVMVGYGPLYPVGYLPAVLAKHPITAVTIATLLAHLYVLGPAALLCRAFAQTLREEGDEAAPHWTFSFLLFALVTHIVPSLTYITAGVHADASACGLFLLACYGVLRSDRPDAAKWSIVAAGLAAGLSVTCKVNLLAGLIALAVWVFAQWGARRAALFVGSATVAGLVVYAWAASRDGFAAVALNLRQPGLMPWFTFRELGTLAITGSSHEFGEKVRTFATFAHSYLRDYGPIALAVLLLTPWRRGEAAAPGARVVRFFLLLALLMTPVSIASIGKYGGDVNSRALVSLPLAFAAVFALVAAAQRNSGATRHAHYAALVGASILVALPLGSASAKWAARRDTTLVEAYSVVSADPGRWYFPYDPLAHVLAEGKFRPNIDVVYSYAMSGVPVDEAAFRSALPENLRYVALPPSVAEWGGTELTRLAPEYMRRDTQLQYAKHLVFSR